MSRLLMPDRLSREALVRIVSRVQSLLYLDLRDDREVWSPEKQWNAGDVAEQVGSILDEHGLVPHEDIPDSDVPSDADDLIGLARERNVQSDDLDDLVHDCAASVASDTNNGGLDAQIQFLLECLGAEGLRRQLLDIVPAANG